MGLVKGGTVFPSQFAYHRPGSVQEAISILQADPDAKIVAGGHSLLPAMKLRLAAPSALVDLDGISSLKGISVNGNVTIGAMTTYAQLRDSAQLKAAMPVLADVANNVGDPQVQSRGTLGGSLAHNDPAADFTAVMVALGASVKVAGPNGERTIPVEDLLVDLLTTSLDADEVLTEVVIPGGTTAASYEKFRHPASGYAVVGIAAAVKQGADGTVHDARIAVTGCTSKATRATDAEQALIGKKLSADSIAAAAAVAANGLDINGDHYASADYRQHLVGVMTSRALERLG
jgi:carbon-monoxide dehydrogenase medium subunit